MGNYMTESIDKFVKYMNQRRFSESTINQYLSYVNKLSKIDSRLYRLTNNQIQNFILESDSASSQNCKINALKLFFKINNPDKRIKVFIRPKKEKKIINILTKSEVWQLINLIDHPKQKAIITGIYLHGLRRSEILKLKYEDIDKERGLLFIRQSKNNKDRLVPLNKDWLKYLAEYSKCYNHKKGHETPIFYLYSPGSIYKIIKNKAALLGITKNVYPHLLRDCYASHLLEQGVDTRYIQEILGHSKIQTTQKYLHVSALNISTIQLEK